MPETPSYGTSTHGCNRLRCPICWFVQTVPVSALRKPLSPEQTKIVACPRTDINDLKSQGLSRWERKSRWKGADRNQVKGSKQLSCLENQKQEECESSVKRLGSHQCGPREMPGWKPARCQGVILRTEAGGRGRPGAAVQGSRIWEPGVLAALLSWIPR